MQSPPKAPVQLVTLERVPKQQLFTDLVADGRIPVGAVVFHRSRGLAAGTVEATVEPEGLRILGKLYRSPSTAALAVGGHAANGWLFWRLRTTGETLHQLRASAE